MKEMTTKGILILWAMPLLLLLGCVEEYPEPFPGYYEMEENSRKRDEEMKKICKNIDTSTENNEKYKAKNIKNDDGTVLEGPEIEIGNGCFFFYDSDDENNRPKVGRCKPIDRKKKSITCKKPLGKDESIGFQNFKEITFDIEDKDLDNKVFDDEKNCYYEDFFGALNCKFTDEEGKEHSYYQIKSL